MKSLRQHARAGPHHLTSHSAQQKGVCKKFPFSHILYNHQKSLNTNNPPYEPYILTIFYQTWALEVICFFQTPIPIFHNCQFTPKRACVICDSKQNLRRGGGAGEGVGTPFQSLPSKRPLPINRSPDFFFTSSVKQWFITTLLSSRPLAGHVFVQRCLVIGVWISGLLLKLAFRKIHLKL